MKLFTAKCHEQATLRKLWCQTGNEEAGRSEALPDPAEVTGKQLLITQMKTVRGTKKPLYWGEVWNSFVMSSYIYRHLGSVLFILIICKLQQEILGVQSLQCNFCYSTLAFHVKLIRTSVFLRWGSSLMYRPHWIRFWQKEILKIKALAARYRAKTEVEHSHASVQCSVDRRNSLCRGRS